MCGLAGSFHPDTDEEDPWVEAALDLIAHRGPDARGVVTWTAATHGHVRLSIFDPEPRSNQPFVSGGTLLSYNGELWNWRELRADLEEAGAVKGWKTEGDTEVVAAALDYWGAEEALTRFEGQFALAFTESLTGRTVLARDRFGEVPLYVLRQEQADLFGSLNVLWASERKAFGQDHAADAEPVPAGCLWDLSRPGPEAYYEPLIRGMQSVEPEDVLALLETAVDRRLQADVPVCCLVSGGLDSALTLALVKLRKPDVVAYTAKMDGESADLAAARRLCAELEVPLVEVPVRWPTREDFFDAIRCIEIPMKAQVEIAWPCMALAKRIYADGFRVALSGEGADELFGGYGNLARKATGDREWIEARRASVAKMARGNFVRVNKSFMSHGVEGRLPFVDRALIEAVLPLGVKSCPPQKLLLKWAADALLPGWVIARKKETFQGAVGSQGQAQAVFAGDQIKSYNAFARAEFGGLPRG